MSSFDDQQGGAPPGAGAPSAISGALDKVRNTLGGSSVPPAPPPPPGEEDTDDDGMVRMSFMDHLSELRSRLLKAIAGIIVAAVGCLSFSYPLWDFVSKPATEALKSLGVNPPELVMITPMEGFNVIWFKLPLICAIFVASPWILYQVWAFIAPGLYRRERRWAAPFILVSAGLFITGGIFAYFVVFRFGLTFLLGIGMGHFVRPMVTISEYFDLFVNVILGVSLVFELPVLIFFLTLLRLASPRFLIRHSRYAILAITVLAAVVTPTPDVFNMMLFAVPMVLLFFVGVFVSYLLVLKREGKKFPWVKVLLAIVGVIVAIGIVIAIFVFHYHYHLVAKWPYLMK